MSVPPAASGSNRDRAVPLDPGRVNILDPEELRYWCEELSCSEAALKSAVARAGPHAAAVREALADG